MALPEILTGMKVVIKNVFRRKETIAYPEVRRQPWPRFKGRHILDRHPDGLEKCIGCELCAGVCPADAIYVVGAENTSENRFSPGERYAQIYQINYLRCIFCGLCVEACPTEALLMTTEYELSGSSREELVYTKDQLIVDSPILRHWATKKEVAPAPEHEPGMGRWPNEGTAGDSVKKVEPGGKPGRGGPRPANKRAPENDDAARHSEAGGAS